MATVPDQLRIITGRQLLQALADAGVISKDHPNTCRVVIDIRADSYPVIYVEMAGDERLLQVTQTLAGVQIDRGQPPQIAAAPEDWLIQPTICGCGAHIFFAATDGGKAMPVVVGSADDPDGTLAVWRDGERFRCRVLKTGEDIQPGEHRYRSHFADCPDAARYRRTR